MTIQSNNYSAYAFQAQIKAQLANDLNSQMDSVHFGKAPRKPQRTGPLGLTVEMDSVEFGKGEKQKN